MILQERHGREKESFSGFFQKVTNGLGCYSPTNPGGMALWLKWTLRDFHVVNVLSPIPHIPVMRYIQRCREIEDYFESYISEKKHESWMQVAKFHLKLSNLEPSCKLLGGRLVFTNQQLVERISHSFFLNWNLWVYQAGLVSPCLPRVVELTHIFGHNAKDDMDNSIFQKDKTKSDTLHYIVFFWDWWAPILETHPYPRTVDGHPTFHDYKNQDNATPMTSRCITYCQWLSCDCLLYQIDVPIIPMIMWTQFDKTDHFGVQSELVRRSKTILRRPSCLP